MIDDFDESEAAKAKILSDARLVTALFRRYEDGGIDRLVSRSFFFSQKSKRAVQHQMNYYVCQAESVKSGETLVVG